MCLLETWKVSPVCFLCFSLDSANISECICIAAYRRARPKKCLAHLKVLGLTAVAEWYHETEVSQYASVII